MKYDLQGLCNHLVNDPKPVIMLDTCVILDVIRTCIREDLNHCTVGSVRKLLTNNSTNLVIHEIVEEEFDRNLTKVFFEAQKRLEGADKLLKHFKNCLDQAPELGSLSLIKKPSEFRLHSSLEAHARDLVNQALVLEADSTCNNQAMTRVLQSVPPATRGKNEPADCAIYMHYLALANKLRRHNFDEPIVFISSNKADFGEPRSPRQPIGKELSELNVHFVNNLPWALSKI
ncbi:PIN domain-containing protein [Pseudoalteromonas sp. Of7M-16]|uniref:PIN domain-containing protein n=1 Tax=Pseudoalteromonas sp. Of7M-16 TaxID=2917756 RepID=UPI001EF44801|nr:PIN domain-containing protein [Pseudoalteromonas sp. Of7M-16]MCG7549200.1 PIN domain-containing protein [Pseudoalteromonas sp. Of7M-16]